MLNFIITIVLSAIVGFACLFIWDYVWVFWVIGVVLLFTGFNAMNDGRVKDRRFKTGFRNNAEDTSDLGLGLKLICASVLIFVIAFNARDILPRPHSGSKTETSSSIKPTVVETHAPSVEPLSPATVTAAPKPSGQKQTSGADTSHPETASEEPRNKLIDVKDKVFTDEEIDKLEEEKHYHGNDPIVRARLGLPSRTTKRIEP